MRSFHVCVFDDFVVGNTQVFTDPKWNWQLGSADRLRLVAVVDQVGGTTPTFSAQIRESADNRNFTNKNATAEINAVSIAATTTNVASGYDANPYTPPLCGFVQIGITLGWTSPIAHVKLYVTGRGEVVTS